jgi:hypothetical protein
MTRRKRAIIIALETPEELEVGRVVHAGVRTSASSRKLERSGYHVRQNDGLYGVEAEIFCAAMVIEPPHQINPGGHDETAGVTEESKDGCAGVQQPVGLPRWFLKLVCEMAVEWCQTDCRQSETADRQEVTYRE